MTRILAGGGQHSRIPQNTESRPRRLVVLPARNPAKNRRRLAFPACVSAGRRRFWDETPASFVPSAGVAHSPSRRISGRSGKTEQQSPRTSNGLPPRNGRPTYGHRQPPIANTQNSQTGPRRTATVVATSRRTCLELRQRRQHDQTLSPAALCPGPPGCRLSGSGPRSTIDQRYRTTSPRPSNAQSSPIHTARFR